MVTNLKNAPLILIVDDDSLIRRLCARVLSRAGFTTLAASDGTEAVQQFSDHSGEIAAVLLDLSLPNERGDTIFYKCHTINPQIPIIMMSGYDKHTVASIFTDPNRSPSGYLSKPFMPTDIVELINKKISTGQE